MADEKEAYPVADALEEHNWSDCSTDCKHPSHQVGFALLQIDGKTAGNSSLQLRKSGNDKVSSAQRTSNEALSGASLCGNSKDGPQTFSPSDPQKRMSTWSDVVRLIKEEGRDAKNVIKWREAPPSRPDNGTNEKRKKIEGKLSAQRAHKSPQKATGSAKKSEDHLRHTGAGGERRIGAKRRNHQGSNVVWDTSGNVAKVNKKFRMSPCTDEVPTPSSPSPSSAKSGNLSSTSGTQSTWTRRPFFVEVLQGHRTARAIPSSITENEAVPHNDVRGEGVSACGAKDSNSLCTGGPESIRELHQFEVALKMMEDYFQSRQGEAETDQERVKAVLRRYQKRIDDLCNLMETPNKVVNVSSSCTVEEEGERLMEGEIDAKRERVSRKHAAAEERRMEALAQRKEKCQQSLARVEQVNARREEEVKEKSRKHIEKQQKAEELHDAHLQQIRFKAKDEYTKVQEVAFINSLANGNMKLTQQVKMDEAEKRREQLQMQRVSGQGKNRRKGAAKSVEEKISTAENEVNKSNLSLSQVQHRKVGQIHSTDEAEGHISSLHIFAEGSPLSHSSLGIENFKANKKKLRRRRLNLVAMCTRIRAELAITEARPEEKEPSVEGEGKRNRSTLREKRVGQRQSGQRTSDESMTPMAAAMLYLVRLLKASLAETQYKENSGVASALGDDGDRTMERLGKILRASQQEPNVHVVFREEGGITLLLDRLLQLMEALTETQVPMSKITSEQAGEREGRLSRLYLSLEKVLCTLLDAVAMPATHLCILFSENFLKVIELFLRVAKLSSTFSLIGEEGELRGTETPGQSITSVTSTGLTWQCHRQCMTLLLRLLTFPYQFPIQHTLVAQYSIHVMNYMVELGFLRAIHTQIMETYSFWPTSSSPLCYMTHLSDGHSSKSTLLSLPSCLSILWEKEVPAGVILELLTTCAESLFHLSIFTLLHGDLSATSSVEPRNVVSQDKKDKPAGSESLTCCEATKCEVPENVLHSTQSPLSVSRSSSLLLSEFFQEKEDGSRGHTISTIIALLSTLLLAPPSQKKVRTQIIHCREQGKLPSQEVPELPNSSQGGRKRRRKKQGSKSKPTELEKSPEPDCKEELRSAAGGVQVKGHLNVLRLARLLFYFLKMLNTLSILQLSAVQEVMGMYCEQFRNPAQLITFYFFPFLSFPYSR